MSEIDPKLSRLYREASSESPPSGLDAAILAAARKRVAKPQRRSQPWYLGWLAPASAIATLALGVSIALLVEREQGGNGDDTAIRENQLRPQSPLQPQTAPQSQTSSPPQVVPQPQTSPQPQIAPQPQISPPQQISSQPQIAPRPQIAPPPQIPPQIPPQQQIPPPDNVTEAAKMKAADRAAPAAEKKEMPAAAAPAPAPPSAQAFPAESRAKTAAPGTRRESNVSGDSVGGEQGNAAADAPAAAGRLAPLRQPAPRRSPEAWLEEIARLRREGRDKEAVEQLDEFRKIYPAYALPESLTK